MIRRVLDLTAGLLAVGMLLPAAVAAQEPDVDEPTVEEVLASTRHDVALARFAPEQTTPSACEPVTDDLALDSDLDCRLDVVGDDLVIDLNGFTLTGGLRLEGDRLTVRNGTITGEVNLDGGTGSVLDRVEVRGVEGFAVTLGCDDVVTSSRFVDNEVALDLFFCSTNRVERSTFTGNDIAVNIASGTDHVVERNRFDDNVVAVSIRDEDEVAASDSVVRRNVFRDNDLGVILTANAQAVGNRIERNAFTGHASSGVVVVTQCFLDEGCATGTQIARNVLFDNGSNAGDLTFEDLETAESVVFTPDDGITVVGEPGFVDRVTLERNVATRNADLGIDAAGVTDGGRNVAVGNGDPEECVGVRC